MLAASPLRTTRDESQGEMESLSSMGTSNDEFANLSEGSLLESINFDDLFVGINVDGDVLPDLEMDGEVFAEFSAGTAAAGGEESEMRSSVENCCSKGENCQNHVVAVSANSTKKEKEEEDKSDSGSGGDSGPNSGTSREEEIVSRRDESVVVNPSPKNGGKGRKSSSQSKRNPQGKKKVKVDWTPELHRRFVQAVEQLGVDKAVPSRILEIMGIDCLTRHNIASHLQKYRSHRKHLLTREAEAANWSQRRQMYGVTSAGGGGKRDVSPWLTPTMGFPPITPMHHFRPLHVWGHPSMDQPFMHMWPKHIPPSPPPPPPSQSLPLSWAPPAAPPPPPDPSFWHAQHQRVPNAPTAGTPCFPQAPTTTRFGSPTVPGIPTHAMYKADPGIGVPGPRPLFDFHPSKESIDAAIGDVLSKPWLPLPLGLKAPALDSVLGELQRQGIPKVPPSCA